MPKVSLKKKRISMNAICISENIVHFYRYTHCNALTGVRLNSVKPARAT